MPALTISGIDLNFPFEPYPCQVNYMKCVLDSIIEVSLFYKTYFLPFLSKTG